MTTISRGSGNESSQCTEPAKQCTWIHAIKPSVFAHRTSRNKHPLTTTHQLHPLQELHTPHPHAIHLHSRLPSRRGQRFGYLRQRWFVNSLLCCRCVQTLTVFFIDSSSTTATLAAATSVTDTVSFRSILNFTDLLTRLFSTLASKRGRGHG